MDERKKKRERRLYLCKVAKEVCDFLDGKIEPHEGCEVRQMAERMWDYQPAVADQICVPFATWTPTGITTATNTTERGA